MKHSGQSGTMWADWWARMLMCDIHVPAQTCTSQRSRGPRKSPYRISAMQVAPITKRMSPWH